jgi:glycosyltransferase 2 family protein
LKLPVKQLLLALCAAATVYALVLLLSGGSSALVPLVRLASPTGILAAALCVLSYALRGLRWRRWMAQYQRPLKLMEGLRLYLAGYTFTPTPGNIGEAMRGLLLAHQPLSAAQSLAIFGAERLADLLCLLLLCLPGLWWLLQSWPAAISWWPVLTLAAGLTALLGWLLLARYKTALFNRYIWLQQAWQCLATRPLIWLALTGVAWGAQGLAVWLIFTQSGLDINVAQATGFYALAMVGGALSMLPAGLGGMEAILTGLLISHGALAGVAIALTISVRLLTLWLAVAIGAVVLLYSATVRKDIRLS